MLTGAARRESEVAAAKAEAFFGATHAGSAERHRGGTRMPTSERTVDACHPLTSRTRHEVLTGLVGEAPRRDSSHAGSWVRSVRYLLSLLKVVMVAVK